MKAQEAIEKLREFCKLRAFCELYPDACQKDKCEIYMAIEALSEPSRQGQQNGLISHRDAIEAIDEITWYHQNANKDMVSGANSNEHQAWYKAEDVYKALESVPSTQPEQPTEVQDILQYLDDILHPIVSPEHWSVYSELHDMVSKLQSAQPEREILDELIEIMKAHYFMHRYEYGEAWENGFATCMNLIPNVYEKRKR